MRKRGRRGRKPTEGEESSCHHRGKWNSVPWETQRDGTETSVILLGAEEAGVYPPAPQASYTEVCVGDIRSPALPAVPALAASVPLKLGRDLRITGVFRKQPKWGSKYPRGWPDHQQCLLGSTDTKETQSLFHQTCVDCLLPLGPTVHQVLQLANE